MAQNIFITDESYQELREKVKEKLQGHPDFLEIGKADQTIYVAFVEEVQEKIRELISKSNFEEGIYNFQKIKNPVKKITYYTLWTLFSQTVRHPKKRQRTKKSSLELLHLFAYGEIDKERLKEESKEEKELRKILPFENNSGATYYSKLPINVLQSAIDEAKEEIKIIDTFLDNWGKLKPYFKRALARGCKIKILLCDPDSIAVKLRSKKIFSSGNPNFPKTWIDNKDLKTQSWINSENIEIEHHNHFPGFNLFAIDNRYFAGLFWYGHEAMEGPFLEIKENLIIKEKMDLHFNDLFRKAIARKNEGSSKNIDSRLEKFQGVWHVYCNKGKKGKESYQLPVMEPGLVVENLLKLKEESGRLKAQFFSHNHGEFFGEAFFCKFNDSYLEMHLNTGESNNTLYFLLHVGHGLPDHFTGLYNYMYHEQPILGSGLAAMARVLDKSLAKVEFEDWQKRDTNTIQEEEIKKLIRYLVFPTDSRLDSVQDFSHFQQLPKYFNPFPFKGVYKIYAYKGGKMPTYITESLLQIDEYRRVHHRRGGYKKLKNFVNSIGKAETTVNKGMIISLKNLENNRIGFFMIDPTDRKPSLGTYFTGIFVGPALNQNPKAIGNRVILEYLGEDLDLFDKTSIKRYSLLSDEINELPEAIKINLSGRVNNFIGFLRTSNASTLKKLKDEAKDEVSMKDVFFDSACQRALTNDANQIWDAAKMFERAVLHGYRPLTDFAQKLDEYEAEGWILSRMKNDILKNEVYINIMNS